MNPERIYEALLMANTHAKNMNMDSVDAVYHEQLELSELRELKLFLKDKGLDAESYGGYNLNELHVCLSHCSITIYDK